jgi:3-methyladenine DNA glycosylase AlkD
MTVAPSATTRAATRFVAEHQTDAGVLGARLAQLAADPDAFVRAIGDGFAHLADPAYREGQMTIAPGIDNVIGVRLPLMEAAYRSFKKGTRETAAPILLRLADRLLERREMELRWFAIWDLGRPLAIDPESTWPLMRRAAAEAHEWITVDMLAHPYGEGILREPSRWDELRSLMSSSSRWERRLVGSTVATIPFAKGMPGGRDPATAAVGLDLIGELMGDSEPDVQKALSWALRNLAAIDRPLVTEFLERETETARATDDGYRAWVVRDSLAKIDPDRAATLTAALEGIRRRPGAPSTSRAATTGRNSQQ